MERYMVKMNFSLSGKYIVIIPSDNDLNVSMDLVHFCWFLYEGMNDK